jgi:hypothetical protein
LFVRLGRQLLQPDVAELRRADPAGVPVQIRSSSFKT